MKKFAIIAFLSTVLAGSYTYPQEVSTDYLTTYTTVTTCPATETVTAGGSTYIQTVLTTSTIVVTECPGGSCEGEVTETLPDTTIGTTTQVEITYTTTCPITEIITIGGSTHTQTRTVTSVVVTHVDTTVVETATAPPVTRTTRQVIRTTKTSLCPVTETKTVAGETVVATWFSTATIVTDVPFTVTEEVSTSVFETVTYPVTTVATISEGTTVYLTETNTSTLSTIQEFTITKTIPISITDTATEYASYTVTESVWTSVYETITHAETTFTTVSAGSTICITETGTSTIYATAQFTATETIPVTVTEEVDIWNGISYYSDPSHDIEYDSHTTHLCLKQRLGIPNNGCSYTSTDWPRSPAGYSVL
ncbi:hypothetical protein GGR57DRAFT_508051 [Xylariaceae sp. FL1272]|nr:hypothetical protein GGR57DRAFT_508051 [Xylariaceae sp. FL1272]